MKKKVRDGQLRLRLFLLPFPSLSSSPTSPRSTQARIFLLTTTPKSPSNATNQVSISLTAQTHPSTQPFFPKSLALPRLRLFPPSLALLSRRFRAHQKGYVVFFLPSTIVYQEPRGGSLGSELVFRGEKADETKSCPLTLVQRGEWRDGGGEAGEILGDPKKAVNESTRVG